MVGGGPPTHSLTPSFPQAPPGEVEEDGFEGGALGGEEACGQGELLGEGEKVREPAAGSRPETVLAVVGGEFAETRQAGRQVGRGGGRSENRSPRSTQAAGDRYGESTGGTIVRRWLLAGTASVVPAGLRRVAVMVRAPAGGAAAGSSGVRAT